MGKTSKPYPREFREDAVRLYRSSGKSLLTVSKELEPQHVSVSFEATYGWYWFADLLKDAGIEAHMAHPLATKATMKAAGPSPCVHALAPLARLTQARSWSVMTSRKGRSLFD